MKYWLLFIIFASITLSAIWMYKEYSSLVFDYNETMYGKTADELIDHRISLWKSQKIHDLEFFDGSRIIIEDRWPNREDLQIRILEQAYSLPHESSLRRSAEKSIAEIYANEDMTYHDSQKARLLYLKIYIYDFHLLFNNECQSKVLEKIKNSKNLLEEEILRKIAGYCDLSIPGLLEEANGLRSIKTDISSNNYIAQNIYKSVLISRKSNNSEREMAREELSKMQ